LSLGDGLAIFTVAHRGGQRFRVTLLDEAGQPLDGIAAGEGTYDGSYATSLGDPCDCRIAVEGDGAWAIRIQQPTPTSARPLPTTFAGQGDHANDFFQVDHGLVRFRATHRGPGAFRGALLTADGEEIDRLALGQGDDDGSRTVELGEGVYLLQVEAQGTWTVDAGAP
jgi:hypothetical protein